jgi:lipopolysaccharide export system permease protein
MVSIKRYISTNFTKSFLIIFIPFFLSVSLVYLVKISSLTSQIQLTFAELLTLYTYSIPDIVFYTLPLSFIVSLANVFTRLSQDNELMALYALGFKSRNILRSFLVLGFLFSFLLFSISFLAMPLGHQFFNAFKEKKISEAKLNISIGEIGQKFGDYYIYVKNKQNKLLQDIVIYNRTNIGNEQFFSAKTGEIKHHNHTTSLLLNDGYAYTYSKNKLQQAKYKTLEVYIYKPIHPFQFEDVITFWKKSKKIKQRQHKFLFLFFVDLIPLLSIYIIASFTIINPRYHTDKSFLVAFSTSLLLYIIASALEKWGTLYILLITLILVTLWGRWIFNKRVEKYF